MGSWWRNKKATVEDRPSVDIRWLARENKLPPGTTMNIHYLVDGTQRALLLSRTTFNVDSYMVMERDAKNDANQGELKKSNPE